MTWQEIIAKSQNTILVENSPRRIRAALKSNLKPICIACTAHQMAEALESNKDYTLWLDYDLTRIWTRRKKRSNTLEIIKIYKDYIKESGCKLIVIHSWNPWGRKLLQKELKEVGIEIILKRHWKTF